MSFFDLRYNKNKKQGHWEGMKPPDLSVSTLWADLRWHKALYKANKLPLATRIFFYLCRITQLTAYYFGWKKGMKHGN